MLISTFRFVLAGVIFIFGCIASFVGNNCIRLADWIAGPAVARVLNVFLKDDRSSSETG